MKNSLKYSSQEFQNALSKDHQEITNAGNKHYEIPKGYIWKRHSLH